MYQSSTQRAPSGPVRTLSGATQASWPAKMFEATGPGMRVARHVLPFTDIALSALLAEDKDLAHQLEDLHGSIGEAFYWVIGLHVLAALYHHLVRRDDTLRRML